MTNDFALLSHLWLKEPSVAEVERAVSELGLPAPSGDNPVAQLAEAYANLFLLNVFPYGSAFTDRDGELNGTSAQLAARAFEVKAFAPRELGEVAAADHLGLCLAFMDAMGDRSSGESPIVASFVDDLAMWAPVCCLAVEREPGGHPFYRALAERTRVALFQHALPTHATRPEVSATVTGVVEESLQEADEPEDEVRLSDILRFLLAPARCGLFLSRAQLGHMALQLGSGIRLPFGTRYEVARSLFTAAGEAELAEQLFDLLAREIVKWGNEYRSWMAEYPAWGHSGWLSKTMRASQLLAELRARVSAR